MRDLNKKIADTLETGENVTITCPKGPRIEFDVGGRMPKVEKG